MQQQLGNCSCKAHCWRKKRKKKWKKTKKEKSRLSIVNLNSFFFLLQLLSQPVSVPAEHSQRLHLNSIFPSPLAGALASAAITTCFPALCTHKSAPTSSEPFFLRRKDTLPFPPSPRPLSLIGYPIPPVISSELVGESIPSALLYSTETEKK